MGKTVIGCLLLFLMTGCNRAERRSLAQFLEVAAASLGHSYKDQLKDVPNSERRVRFRVLFSRDQVAAIDGYLSTNPPFGAIARQLVEDYRTTKAAELELYEKLLAEKRYVLTEAEERRDRELQAEALRLLDEIGRLGDG